MGTTTAELNHTDELLKLSDVARALKVTYRRVRQLVAANELAAVNVRDTGRGPTWRVEPVELERFAVERARPRSRS